MNNRSHILADNNLVESIREHARWQDESECVEEHGLLLLAGATDLPVPYQNCLIRTDPSISAQEVLDRARVFFGTRSKAFMLLVREGQDRDLDVLCQTTGLKLRANTPCMLINHPFGPVDAPDGIRAERFTEERHVQDAIRVNSEAYSVLGLNRELVRAIYGNPSRLLSGNAEGYVLYRGNRPVSTAMAIFSGQGAGVYWVGTVPEAQGAGLATICTRLATNAGFHHGASIVTLQASPYGEPIYRRLGYKMYDRLKFYAHRKQK
jgi:ribosomal protein S18 acetylase RimI-like enzyme